MFWSLRNPDYPEKILRTAQPVTALDFSKLNPMTLAVGLLNGDIHIYDVKREGEKFEVPVESSAGMDNCHTDPVWYLRLSFGCVVQNNNWGNVMNQASEVDNERC